MGERELRERFGGKLDKAINRAIRAEVAGGNEALDKLTQLAGAARHSHWEDKQGRPTPEAAAYFKHQREVVGRMEAEVRQRWGIPPARESKAGPKAAAATRRPRQAPTGRPGAIGPGKRRASAPKTRRAK